MGKPTKASRLLKLKRSTTSKPSFTMTDKINHPDHYAKGRKHEPIDVIEDWELGFRLGNAVKYISRAGRKDGLIEDLKKAIWYIEREIQYLEKLTEAEYGEGWKK